MNIRIIPCAICHEPIDTESLTAATENAPELLHHPRAWFGIVRAPDGQIGMVSCCSKDCGQKLVTGTPVLVSAPVGSA